MIAHVVLFRPRSALSPSERAAFVDALAQALNNIPLIARARLGRRLRLGRPYDAHNRDQFPYFAVLEFETEADLRAYLDHPVHEALGAEFYERSEAALVFDYVLLEVGQASELLL